MIRLRPLPQTSSNNNNSGSNSSITKLDHLPVTTTSTTTTTKGGIQPPPRYKQQHPKQLQYVQQHHHHHHHHYARRRIMWCTSSIIIIVIIIFTIIIIYSMQFNNNNNNNSDLIIPTFRSQNLRRFFNNNSITKREVTPTSTSSTTTSSSSSSSSLVTFDMKEYLQQPENRLRYPIDYLYYTIRINTWERIEQLQLSILHHLSCTSVLQIQIVWCIDQTIVIPDWLLQLEQTIPPIIVTNISYPRIIIERHTINSLNERFHSLIGVPTTTTTAAILSIDDDVIRPCIALDITFYIWLRNPDRQIGFDARSHGIVSSVHHHNHNHHNINNKHHDSASTTNIPPQQQEQQQQPQWKYSYMSVTEKTNLYSLTLTRYSFFHQHYMTLYMNTMPSIIRSTIDTNFNCEDIAMSLFISSCHKQHKVPLLANLWAVKSQIKMYVAQKISGTNHHKEIRDHCVHHFSQLLHLQHQDHHQQQLFHTVPLHLGSWFDYGDIPENWNDSQLPPLSDLSVELQNAITTIERWKQQSDMNQQHVWMKELKQYREDAIKPIFDAGYIEKTIPWQNKFLMMHE